MPGKGSLEVLSSLKTRSDLIGPACDHRAAFRRAMRRKLRLPDVSACVVRNGRLRCPAAVGIVYIATFAMCSTRSGG